MIRSSGKYFSDFLHTILSSCYYSEHEIARCVDKLGAFLGQLTVLQLPSKPAWPSFVTDDHTPIEFSITFSTGKRPVVRMVGEPLPQYIKDSLSMADIVNTAEEFYAQAKAQNSFNWTVYEKLKHLYMVPAENASGPFYACFGVDLQPMSDMLYKIYFNPQVEGPTKAVEKICAAFNLLDMDCAPLLDLQKKMRLPDSAFEFLSFDLNDDPRLKIYIRVMEFSWEVVESLISKSQESSTENAKTFWDHFCSMVNGILTPRTVERATTTKGISITMEYNIKAKSLIGIKCHFPLRYYYHNDEILGKEVQKYLTTHKFVNSENYFDTLTKLSSRKLSARTGMQTVVSTSQKLSGEREVTIYLSPEFYSTYPVN